MKQTDHLGAWRMSVQQLSEQQVEVPTPYGRTEENLLLVAGVTKLVAKE